MINYIGILVIGILVGFVAGIFFLNYMRVLGEREKVADLATGTPIAAELAREMKIKLDKYEERELWV